MTMASDPVLLRIERLAEGLEGALGKVIMRLTPEVCGRRIAPSDPRHELYLGRLRVCVEYHAARTGEGRPIPPARVIARLEAGDLGGAKVRANLLRDVLLAQALQLGEARAAEVFDAEYMPVVRSIARHIGSERAVDALENFAAELVLPREGREPKIATYRGRTTLGHWLGPVVTNAWRTEFRRRKPDGPIRFDPDGRAGALEWAAEPCCSSSSSSSSELSQCEELLRPIFLAAGRLLADEDRLLLQMLMLDGVPQKDLARSLSLNSGTITRRRQRAVETILSGTRRLAAQCPRPRQAEDCLGLVLAGDDLELRRGLADVLASGLRADPASRSRGGGPPS
jgi:DNA-directed RNA polymerase specialized sigma24 family protein